MNQAGFNNNFFKFRNSSGITMLKTHGEAASSHSWAIPFFKEGLIMVDIEKKERRKAYVKKYAIENKEKIAAYREKYAEENKEKIAIARKEYRQKNKEKIKETNSKYYKMNKEKIAIKSREYNEANKEYFSEYKKQWYQDNKIGFDKKSKKYYENNKITILAWHKQYNQDNAEIISIKKKIYAKTENGKNVKIKARYKRKALKLKTGYEEFNRKEIFERDGYKCQHCGKKTRPDYKNYNHSLYPNLYNIIPLSKGGDHTRLNAKCLCHQCNMEKGSNGNGEQLLLFG